MTGLGLKKVSPYWHPCKFCLLLLLFDHWVNALEDATMAKRRWWDREILEVVSTEFRDRSIEYYVSNLVHTLIFLSLKRAVWS